MYQVGITGNMGSGKSLVCSLFALTGRVPIYDADSEAKVMMQDDPEVKRQILDLFGSHAYTPGGALNRKYIGDIAFGDPDKLAALNAIVHPASIARYERWLVRQTAPFTIKEAALLIEATKWQTLDAIIVVTAPEEVRLHRVIMRDTHRSPEQINQIFANQMPEAEKVAKATFVINNDGKTALLPQVLAIYTAIKQAALVKVHINTA
jgi:dephospho-CoA kinase